METTETHSNNIPPAGPGFIYMFDNPPDWFDSNNPEHWKKVYDEGLLSKVPLPPPNITPFY